MKNIVTLLIKIIVLLLFSFIIYKLTSDLYLIALIIFGLVLIFFFKYQEIFIISLALLIATFVTYFFNSQLFYEKIGEFLFISLISGCLTMIKTLRYKDNLDEEA